MTAYYNEFDKRAAAWLRELIAEGHIAAGDVDDRSILDVTPNDLDGYTQCHFFAGIGGWSLALRLAGWDDARPVWTGSCPCQPFSEAGARTGFADERHLWPAWHYLIEQCRPPVLFGEQVEAAIRYGWLDLVRDDLEGIGYAFGAAGLPAACVGAPHIRQRLWFVADSGGERLKFDTQRDSQQNERIKASRGDDAGGRGELGNASDARLALGLGLGLILGRTGGASKRKTSVGADIHTGPFAMGVADQVGCREGDNLDASHERSAPVLPAGAGWWDRTEWLACRDGKARPVEPGIFPLAHGVPDRVGLLRGAGNAIVPAVAAAFIEATLQGLTP